ncbi:MAG TPA: VWA domain-containing protein [Pyrinomonadaceae bacterium]|nr:VWA domain-containing protein [Pyrinomonadaceae bacterium]
MYLRRFSIILVLLSSAIVVSAQEGSVEAKQPPADAMSYGFVIDNSGSFRKLLEDVIQFIGKVLDEQKPGDEAFFVRFIDTEKIKLDQELTSDVNEIRDAADAMYVQAGQTAVVDAVRSAGEYLAENGKAENKGRRAILIVTDGDERASVTKPEAAIKILKDAGIRLIAVAVSDEKVQPKVLERLTRETGGKLFVLKHKGELRTIGSEVAAALRNP